MDSTALLTLFRGNMNDAVAPYFWSDPEVYAYMDDAFKMFARMTGGIADFTTTAVVDVPIVAATPIATLHSSILRIMSATRASDGGEIRIINSTDMPIDHSSDYGSLRPLFVNNTPGPVGYMIIGAERGKVRWIQPPLLNDTANLYVYRLPLQQLTAAGQSLAEIGAEHHFHLLKWMQHLAYLKQDSEIYDKGRSDEQKAAFVDYCALAKAEVERYKHKTRVTAYGGI